MPSDELDDRALDLVLEVEEQLESNPLGALQIAEHAPPESAMHPEVRLARARALLAARGAKEARPWLSDLVAAEPEFAEARHVLAAVLEELGDHAGSVREFLVVRRLDQASDEADGFELAAAEKLIVETAERVVRDLPERFQKLIGVVPILVEDRPSEALVREGFDPRSLGLFDGPDHAERAGGSVPAPTRIVLYAANLCAYADPSDAEELAREVEVTVLHEIGHYFGLDEGELDALGLA
ncbi:MAG TPA: metallopeptidase family protein [Polyangiaceae bacterium]|nr:metallopeptidase family protein [Polyangiaceae bacterium]